MQHGIAGMLVAVRVEFAVHVIQMGAYAAGKGGKKESVMGELDAMVITVVRLVFSGIAGMLVEEKVACAANVVRASHAVAEAMAVTQPRAAMEGKVAMVTTVV